MDLFAHRVRLDLQWKPYFFLHKRALRLAAKGEKSLAEYVQDWPSIHDSIRQLAKVHTRTQIGFEHLRQNTELVGKKLVAPYCNSIMQLTGIGFYERSRLAASIHYCLFRFHEHTLAKRRVAFACFGRPNNSGRGTEAVKREYIRVLTNELVNCSSYVQVKATFVSPRWLNRWRYVSHDFQVYQECSSIVAFKNRCNDDVEQAESSILAV